MPRRPRVCPAGMCFHVLNRAVARLPLFEKREDFEAFERVLIEAGQKRGRSYFFCLSGWLRSMDHASTPTCLPGGNVLSCPQPGRGTPLFEKREDFEAFERVLAEAGLM